MSISTLIVAVRTHGAAALTRLGGQFLWLRAQAAAASSGIGGAFSRLQARMQPLMQSLGRGIAQGVDRLGDALGSILPGLAGLAAKIALVTTFAVPATAALVSLAGAVQLLAPAAVAGIASLLTLKFALKGVGDAISAGLSGDTEAYATALKKLTPQAQDFAKSMVYFGKKWREVQKATQDSFFGGGNLPHWLRRLAIEFQPIAAKWLPAIADGFSRAAAMLAEFLLQPETKAQIGTILAGVKRGIDGLLQSLTPLTQAFLDIAEVAAPLFGNMGEDAKSLAQAFADWVREAKESGKLAAWLQSAVDALGTLMAIAGDVKDMLSAIWSGGKDESQSLLEKIHELTAAFAAWLRTTDGQDMIKFMIFLAQTMVAAIEVVKFLGQAFIGVLRAIDIAFRASALTAVGALGWILEAAARAFGWIPGIGPQLQGAARQFREFQAQVNAALDGIDDETVVVNVLAHVDGSVPRSVANSLAQGRSIRATRFAAVGGQFRAGEQAIVGEKGPELVTFGRSARVWPHADSARMLSGASGGGNAYSITVNVAPGGNLAEAGRQVVEAVKAYERGSGAGWRR